MYPSMIYLYNLSTETINCSCCADDPLAKIPWSVMIIINTRLMKDKNKSNRLPVPHYWICRKKRGKFAEIMLDLYNKKMECKREGNSLKEKAIKLLANSGYGAFGEPHFEFYDFRVAELVTAFAFYTISNISNLLVKKSGDPNIVIYGDTDSIFVNSESLNNKLDIENEVKTKFRIEMSEDKEWHIFAQFGKKEYSGVLSNGKYVTTQIYGTRDDKPKDFIKNTAKLSGLDIILSQNRKEEARQLVKDAYKIMVEKILSNDTDFVRNELGWSQKLSKDLIEYSNNDWHRIIYNERLEDNSDNMELVNASSLKGTVQTFWKIKPIKIDNGDSKKKSEKKYTMHPERYELDLSQYKKDLWTCFENILIAYGFTNEELTQLSNQLID